MATLEGKEKSDPKPPLGSGCKASAQIKRKRFAQLSSCAQGIWSTSSIRTIWSSSRSQRQAGGMLGTSSLEGSCCLLVWASLFILGLKGYRPSTLSEKERISSPRIYKIRLCILGQWDVEHGEGATVDNIGDCTSTKNSVNTGARKC